MMRGLEPARVHGLPNTFQWLSAKISVWPDKTQSRADQQTDPDEVGSLAEAGELAIQGPPQPPSFMSVAPDPASEALRSGGRVLCSMLTDQLLRVRPCAGRWGGRDKGPSGCGFRQGCFIPSALGPIPRLLVRISLGTGERPDTHPRVTLEGPGQIVIGSHSGDRPPQDCVAVISPGREVGPNAVAAAGLNQLRNVETAAVLSSVAFDVEHLTCSKSRASSAEGPRPGQHALWSWPSGSCTN